MPGIGEKRARMIQESYAEQAQQREAMVFLQSYGVTPALAVKIYKRYGENVRQIITRNPYRLVEDVEGIGFKTADRIAATLGIEPDSEYRLNAGVKFALADATAVAGHCYLPRPELALSARRMLGNDPDLIDRTIDSLILSHEISAQVLPGDDGEDVVALYQPATYRAESEVARRLREMIDAMPDTMATDLSAQIDELERVEGIAFHAQQRQAIETAVTSGMTVITGGPGTGKTTIIKCIIKLLSVHGDIALAAPTGRAAKRMSEACGMEAKTLHRLLEYGGEEGDFARTQDNPLEFDTLIIDEMSMVDIFLMRSLLRALVPGTRLIMVGDADQLPSVGAEEGQGVFNGDIGFIVSIDPQEHVMQVQFDDERLAEYEGADVDDLELAYCISVHKSQGSEFPVVVMPAVGGPPMLLTRNLFYTAVTRARRMVMIVGRESAIDQMIANVNTRRRYSALCWRLQQVMNL